MIPLPCIKRFSCSDNDVADTRPVCSPHPPLRILSDVVRLITFVFSIQFLAIFRGFIRVLQDTGAYFAKCILMNQLCLCGHSRYYKITNIYLHFCNNNPCGIRIWLPLYQTGGTDSKIGSRYSQSSYAEFTASLGYCGYFPLPFICCRYLGVTGPSIPGLSFITGVYLLLRPWVRRSTSVLDRLKGSKTGPGYLPSSYAELTASRRLCSYCSSSLSSRSRPQAVLSHLWSLVPSS